jgi:glycosyltransferase involved in cell wall biosynthesis
MDKLARKRESMKRDAPKTRRIDKILHIICPAWNPANKNLYDREAAAVESIRRQCDPSRVKLAAMAAEDPKIDGFEFIQAKDASPPPKSFVKLSEVLEQDYSFILYTNSDCQLADGFYDRLFELGGAPRLFHRLNLEDGKTEIYSHGVDGFLFSKEFHDAIKHLPLDFYLGRPHWDTCLGNHLLENGLAAQDGKSLIHPAHDCAWMKDDADYDSLSAEERHNKDLWSEYLSAGLMSKHELEFDPLKLSVVIVFFGTDDVRITNAKKVLSNLRRQSIDYELVFVEGYIENKNFDYLDGIENNIYIPLRLEDVNQEVWQKEAQMNIGARAATRGIILFMDADLLCHDDDWLERIVESQDGETVLQPWVTINDTEYGKSYVSYIAKHYQGVVSDLPHNPGLCFCVSKSMLEANDYLNPFYIYGGGDSGFIYEYCEDESAYFLLTNYKQFISIYRKDTVKYKSKILNAELTHLFHGNVNDCYFKTRDEDLDDLDIKGNVGVGANGLLEWKEGSEKTREVISDIIKSKKMKR